MKKLNKFLFTIVLLAFIIPFAPVHAAPLNVKTIQASITDNKISVDGTVDSGVLAVAILVYEEDGITLVTMKLLQLMLMINIQILLKLHQEKNM